MEFKVGDRVWAMKPPVGVEKSQWDQVGPGTLVVVRHTNPNGETHKVQLDSGEEWWYSEDSLRHLLQEPANPTPSITVGTQVRLTGVTMSSGKDGEVVTIESDGFVFGVPVGALEVIRQPFKRGEVVYSKIPATNETPFVVLNDESLGFVDVTNCATGFYIPNDSAEAFERRPSRPKEER